MEKDNSEKNRNIATVPLNFIPAQQLMPIYNTVVSVYNLGSWEAAKPEIISERDYKQHKIWNKIQELPVTLL